MVENWTCLNALGRKIWTINSKILMDEKSWKSNKGTGGMESSVVLFKPRIHLFGCTHPSVSNSLDCNDRLAYKHQSTARVQTRLDCGSLLYTSISVHPVFQTCLDSGSLFCVHASVSSTVFQTRLNYGSVSVLQASASCFLGQTRLDFGSLLCTSISLHPVSQARFDYGSLFVNPPGRTKMKVTPELEKISHRARAPNQLSTFLEKEQLFGVDDVALVCTKEELLDETLIAPAKAAGVPCDSLAEKVCIKKVWALCREAFAMGRHGQPASQTEQDDQVLPDEVKRSLDGQWEACHGFVLNTFRLLSENTAKQNLPDVAWCSTSVPPFFFAGINASFVSLDGRQACQSCLFYKRFECVRGGL